MTKARKELRTGGAVLVDPFSTLGIPGTTSIGIPDPIHEQAGSGFNPQQSQNNANYWKSARKMQRFEVVRKRCTVFISEL
eukprot:COSAG02_NODE_402_length_23060_cov_58.831105_8_plen_80_part_00